MRYSKIVPYLSALLASSLVVWVISGSDSFKKCFRDNENKETYEPLKKDFDVITKTAVRIRLNGECGLHFFGDSSAAITAFATIAIAWFTLSLRDSTNKLWAAGNRQFRLAQDEFTATHRPKIFVQSITTHFLSDNGWEYHLGFSIVNGGDTDATTIGYRANLYWHEAETFFAPEVEGQSTYLHNVIVAPGQRFDIVGTHLYDLRKEGFSGEPPVYAVGIVEYQDRDGVGRVTGFCRKYSTDTRMWQKTEPVDYEYTY
jgi:hypothetical protein